MFSHSPRFFPSPRRVRNRCSRRLSNCFEDGLRRHSRSELKYRRRQVSLSRRSPCASAGIICHFRIHQKHANGPDWILPLKIVLILQLLRSGSAGRARGAIDSALMPNRANGKSISILFTKHTYQFVASLFSARFLLFFFISVSLSSAR